MERVVDTRARTYPGVFFLPANPIVRLLQSYQRQSSARAVESGPHHGENVSHLTSHSLDENGSAFPPLLSRLGRSDEASSGS